MKTAAFSAAELRFWGWIPRAPDLSDFYAKGRGGLQPEAPRDCGPPWGPPESRPRRPDFFTAKCESRPRRPDFFTAKRESRPRRPDFFTAKRESRLRRSLLPGRGFFGRAADRNGALPYNARKSQFLRNGDVWATESLFLFAVLWLAFLPDQSETGVAGGGKARRPKPRPPRGGPPNDRDRLPVFAPPARTPDPATPPQSACSRRLSGCPQRPNLSARRRAESPKGKRKGGTPMKRAPPL